MATHPHFLWADLFRRGKSDKKSVIDVLRENILFGTLSEKELAYLATHVYERVYQPDEPIFEQNDRGLGMYVIAKGRVAIKSQNSHPQGENLLVTVLSEGSFFGEMALVDPETIRSAAAVAIDRTVLIGFFKPDLTEIMERNPAMAVKILFQLSAVIGRRLHETTEKITQLKRQRSAKEIA